MTPRLVACTKCRAPLPPVLYNTRELRSCPTCRAQLQVELFPAALRPPGPSSTGEAIVMDGEASCFYHPAKKAVVPCDSCGRFLCAVCDVEMAGQHLCPGCIESGKKKGRMQKLQNRRTLYDSLALAVAVYPIIFLWITMITAPIVIYIAIRYWNAPSSIVPRSRWRMVLAVVLAVLQIGGWITFFVLISSSSRHH